MERQMNTLSTINIRNLEVRLAVIRGLSRLIQSEDRVDVCQLTTMTVNRLLRGQSWSHV